MSSRQKAELVSNAKQLAKKEFDRETLIKLLEEWMIEYSKEKTLFNSK